MDIDLQSTHSALNEAGGIVDEVASRYAKLCAVDGKISAELIDQHQIKLVTLAHLATQLQAAAQLTRHAHNQPANGTLRQQLVRNLAVVNASTVFEQVYIFSLHEKMMPGLLAKNIKADHDTALLVHTTTLIDETGGVGADDFSAEHRAVRSTFRRFARQQVAPIAEDIHREDRDVPESIISGLAEMGCFGLSIPERYGGFQDDAHPDHMTMVIASDELSRASFGTAGSIPTRPELLAKALLKGGTEAQKQSWLPRIASGERQAAVAITEPDAGSDVARVKLAARKVVGGWLLNGEKTWCTFAGRADVLMVLARTDPDMESGHRGLTLFMVEKPVAAGREFAFQMGDGNLSGRAIPTLGYRGMHSFALAFENVFVPDSHVIGEESGIGRGFYLQMHGFSGSRLQTAARALGVMTAAFQEALAYVREREAFGRKLITYPLVQHKLVHMAARIQAGRRLTYHAAAELNAGRGAVTAAMAKLLTGKSAEWVTREALQLHGGMGYAEEFPVSRHFVDARVLSIFEGAEDVLALRIIARALLRDALI
ncbi:MAG: acyl-CoA dehydrogenase family protein [Anaerolineae bacterium]|nr:acyl-CoA dehydrogenase family protein [Anaerolineae bacterium]